jgi:hypothetical protein
VDRHCGKVEANSLPRSIVFMMITGLACQSNSYAYFFGSIFFD